MDQLIAWVNRHQRLQKAGRGNLAVCRQRVVLPGQTPLQGDGFIAFQPVGVVHRVGAYPESLSVLTWVDDGDDMSRDMFSSQELARNIGSLLALIIDRRVAVLPEVSIVSNEQPTNLTFLPMASVADSRLLAPIKPGGDIPKALRDMAAEVWSLADSDRPALSAAMDLHYGACLLYDSDLAGAYTLLVAALETMSQTFGDPPHDWAALPEATEWETFATEARLDVDQLAALKAHLMKDRHLRLKATFVSYGSEAPEEFWTESWQDWVPTVELDSSSTGGSWGDWHLMTDFFPKDRDQLRSALQRAYDARSGFVHQGKRSITLQSELTRIIRKGGSGSAPIPFLVLRSLLAKLIRRELRGRSRPVEMPEVAWRFQALTASWPA